MESRRIARAVANLACLALPALLAGCSSAPRGVQPTGEALPTEAAPEDEDRAGPARIDTAATSEACTADPAAARAVAVRATPARRMPAACTADDIRAFYASCAVDGWDSGPCTALIAGRPGCAGCLAAPDGRGVLVVHASPQAAYAELNHAGCLALASDPETWAPCVASLAARATCLRAACARCPAASGDFSGLDGCLGTAAEGVCAREQGAFVACYERIEGDRDLSRRCGFAREGIEAHYARIATFVCGE